MRPDYCPVGGEPCQSMCEEPCSVAKKSTPHETLIAQLLDSRVPKTEPEPVAWMFQHEETGRTMCVDSQQVEWGFEKGNPRLKKIGPLYTHPPQRKPLTDQEVKVLWADVYEPEPHIWVIAERFARAMERAHGIGGEK